MSDNEKNYKISEVENRVINLTLYELLFIDDAITLMIDSRDLEHMFPLKPQIRLSLVAVPIDLIDKYGADTIRLYMMFTAPPEQSLEWSETAVEGSYRFLKKIWNLVNIIEPNASVEPIKPNDEQLNLRRKTHETIKKVSACYEDKYSFNTAIAAIMELFNSIPESFKANESSESDKFCLNEAVKAILQLMFPITPHISEYLWDSLNLNQESIIEFSWPSFNEGLLVSSEFELIIQVNGKVRGKVSIATDLDDEEIKSIAKEIPNVKMNLSNKNIKKVIIVPGKLINFVV